MQITRASHSQLIINSQEKANFVLVILLLNQCAYCHCGCICVWLVLEAGITLYSFSSSGFDLEALKGFLWWWFFIFNH